MRLTFAGFAAALAIGGLAESGMARAADYYPPANPKSPFSEAVKAGDFLIVSGQLGLASEAPASFEAQSKHSMDAIVAVLSRHGASMDNVVKCTVFLTDMAKFAAFNDIYVGYFKPGRLPARSAMAVKELARGGAVEVECWAYVGR